MAWTKIPVVITAGVILLVGAVFSGRLLQERSLAVYIDQSPDKHKFFAELESELAEQLAQQVAAVIRLRQDGMSKTIQNQRLKHLELIDRVESLNEEVRVLALNLAIYLAKARDDSNQLRRMEHEFIRLVNGTIKVVQQLTHVIGAARKAELGLPESMTPPTNVVELEDRLRAVLDQCTMIMTLLSKQDRRGAT